MTASGTAVPQVLFANTSNDTDLVTTSEEEFDYTLIGMGTQPRGTPSEWTDNGGDPTQILREIGDPIPIEDKSHETHDENRSDPSDDTISEESDYEKQKAKRARKARSPRLHSPTQKSSKTTPTERPKRNKTTTRYQQYNAERSARDQRTIDRKTKQSTHTKPDLPMRDPAQSVHNTAAQNSPDSTSSQIPTPEPFLPYETMPKTLMEALCGKETDHWKKAWEFEMDRITIKAKLSSQLQPFTRCVGI